MNIHIQCLSLIVILFTLNPLSIAELIEFIKRSGKNIKIAVFFRNLTLIYILFIVLSFYLIPQSYDIKMPMNSLWIVIGILCAPLVILLEILTSYIILKLKGEEFSKVKIASKWVNCSVKVTIYTLLIGILEEVVYRQIWFYLMVYILDIHIILVIIISSLFYSLNHITLGKYVVIQKFISGLIFSMLFYLSGYSILIPLICHGLQNLIVVIRGNMNGYKD